MLVIYIRLQSCSDSTQRLLGWGSVYKTFSDGDLDKATVDIRDGMSQVQGGKKYE